MCCDTDSQEGGGSESSSNVSLKNAQSSEPSALRSRSASQSDVSFSDGSFKHASSTNESKCCVAQAKGNSIVANGNASASSSSSQSQSSTSVVKNGEVFEAGPSTLMVNGNRLESDLEKDPSRRPSKDESLSSSSDSPSGDEYNVYYYDAKAAAGPSNGPSKEAKNDQPTSPTTAFTNLFLGIRFLTDF